MRHIPFSFSSFSIISFRLRFFNLFISSSFFSFSCYDGKIQCKLMTKIKKFKTVGMQQNEEKKTLFNI